MGLSLQWWLDRPGLELPELYLVGGTVRDLIIGAEPKDIDLVCTNARNFARRLADLIAAAVVPMEKKPEQPCYRVVDRDRTDNCIDIAEMRGATILEDLAQRDFTVNAIARSVGRDGSVGEIIDPFRGREDIEGKRIRMIDAKVFDADPLRLLRAIRLVASLGYTVEPATRRAMEEKAGLISGVSAERITSELFLILATPHACASFREMDLLGILDALFPEVVPMKGCEQDGYHHQDVWEHSLLVMENAERIILELPAFFGDLHQPVAACLRAGNCREILKLAAFLHDVGKPPTKGKNAATGRITFYRHARAGALIAGTIAGRMRMSNRDRDGLVLLISKHLRALGLADGEGGLAARTRWFRQMGDAAIPSIILGMADVMSSQGPESSQEYRAGYLERSRELVCEYLGSVRKRLEAPALVNGRDIIALGISPGPRIGEILSLIREAQDRGEIASREAGLALARRLAGEGKYGSV